MLLSCVLPLSKLFTIIFKPREIHCFIQGNDYIFYYKVLIKVNHASHQANAAFPTQRLLQWVILLQYVFIRPGQRRHTQLIFFHIHPKKMYGYNLILLSCVQHMSSLSLSCFNWEISWCRNYKLYLQHTKSYIFMFRYIHLNRLKDTPGFFNLNPIVDVKTSCNVIFWSNSTW